MPQQCAEPPPRPPPTGAKQGHNPPTTPPPQPDSPGKPPKPHPPNPTHPRGSSPHTRGARPRCRRPPSDRRIIPAYAGSTSERRRRLPFGRDHPRIRGEHPQDDDVRVYYYGSSPHTRGALVVFSLDPHFRRIIPAYAGSTVTTRGRIPSHADHPRIRGEHQVLTVPGDALEGSSPHTRGALSTGCSCGGQVRIIPAYAGSTDAATLGSHIEADHPRIRGEHDLL